MWLSDNYKKLIRHLKNGGLVYALWRGIKYFIFLINRFKLSNPLIKKHRSYQPENRISGVSKESNGVLLIQCPPWDTAMPPLGIAYLSSYLAKYGYKNAVFDLNISLYHLAPKDLKYLWEQKSYNFWVDEYLFKNNWPLLREVTKNCVVELLQKEDMRHIGLSVNFASIRFANELIKIIKDLKREAKIILGGWGCVNEHMRSLFPKELVDVFVVGEGEETLKEAIEVLGGYRKTGDVLGAIFNNNRGSIYRPRLPIMDLDIIPWPRFCEFNLRQYTTPVVPLFTSRGCIGACSFCNDWNISRPYRYHSAETVFEEIKYHIENNRITVFSFKDLLCNGNIDRLNLLCGLIMSSGLKIQWDSQAIPRKEMTYELLCKLKKSGCSTLIYGVESFSNNVLKRMRKLFTQEVAERVIRDTHAAGINTMINIIVGFPGETESDFQETCEAIERNQKYIGQIGAISVCLVNNDSALDINPNGYELVLPSDSRIRAKEWVSADGKNTYEMRKARAEKILALINRIGLSYATITI